MDGPLERGRVARFDVCAVEAVEPEAEVRETAMLECGRAMTRGTAPFDAEVGVAGSRPARA